MKTVLNIDAIKDGSIGLDKLSEDTQSQLEKINEIEGKQDKLISGNNIKTINGASILGEGDITISVNEEDLTEILDRVSENEKVTAHALTEFKENLDGIVDNMITDRPIATEDTIGGIKIGSQLATSSTDRICLAGDNVGNVGINVDSNYFTLNEQGLTIKEGSVSNIKVTWGSNSNMNDFKTPGVYDIYGERTKKDDNLPIINSNPGHSISGRLYVIASTLQPSNTEISITQILMLSNRKGGDGNIYIRSYNENNSPFENGWSLWRKLLGYEEGYIFTNNRKLNQDWGLQTIEVGLNWMVDNGNYSGVYVNEEAILQKGDLDSNGNGWGEFNTDITKIKFIETFNITTINDYAVAGQVNSMLDGLGLGAYKRERQICQVKTATDFFSGTSSIKKRVYLGNDNDYGNNDKWSDWENIGGNAGTVCIDEYVWDERLQGTGLYGLLTSDLTKDLIEPNVTYELRLGTGDITGPSYNGTIFPENDIPMLDPDNKITKHIVNTQINIDGYRSVGKCYIKYYKPKSQMIDSMGRPNNLANPTVEIDYYGGNSNHNIYTFNPETFKEVYVNGNIKLDSEGREILNPIDGGGNSSSNGGAYGLVEHGASDTTFSLTPNTFHIWDEVTELTLTFEEETAGVANEYLFQFESGTEPTVLTLPTNIIWANDEIPIIESGYIYQVSILKGFATLVRFVKPIILINFNADNITFTAEEGMTWDDFINSNYNPYIVEGVITPKPVFKLKGDIVQYHSTDWMTYFNLQNNNNNVLKNELVIANGVYQINAPSAPISGVTI